MEDYQQEKLEIYRNKRVLSVFPFIICRGFESDFHWTGKWFKYVWIRQQKIRERYTDFDDGWNYQYYWKEWQEDWVFIEFIDPNELTN